MKHSVLLTFCHFVIVFLSLAFCDVILTEETQYEGSLCYLGSRDRTRGQCRKSCPGMDISEYKNHICNPGMSPTLYCCHDKEAARLYPTLYNECMDRLLAENLFKRFERNQQKLPINGILRQGYEQINNRIRADCEVSQLEVDIDERPYFYRMCMGTVLTYPVDPEFERFTNGRELTDVSVAGLGFRRRSGGRVRWMCTGYYVHPVYVLTSAHCFTGTGEIPNVVRHGRLNLNDEIYDAPGAGGLSTYRIVNTIIHEEYDEKTNFADIALVEVFRDIASEDLIQYKPVPACLWTKKTKPERGFTVVGYDDVFHNGFRGPYKPETCKYDRNISQGTMACFSCGFKAKTKVVGMMLQNEELYQNVSYVYAVGSGAYPCRQALDGALFTYVYPYLEWIEKVISR